MRGTAVRLMAGARFGMLTFIESTDERRRGYQVGSFLCDCGRQATAVTAYVISGRVRSCGCNKCAQKTHGMRYSPEYRAWINARVRCENPKDRGYSRYGGRGVKFLYRPFEKFVAEMGLRPPGCELHRINNDGHYEPGNCVWLPGKEHSRLHAKTLPRKGSRWASKK